jgi:nitrile hydratase accessory protein
MDPYSAHRARRRPFALALTLHDKGVFTWSEWATALSNETKTAQAAGDQDTGETYYLPGLPHSRELVAAKNVTTPEALARFYGAWDAAVRRTPRGPPIELRAEDFRT